MLEYNTARNKLIIREYGRNIQKMIEDAVKIEDRGRRNEAAKAIVKAMAFASPAQANASGNNAQVQKERQSIDYWQKLWDHLFIISNYQLEVDSPFPKPQPTEKEKVKFPQAEYHKGTIRTRSYGRNLEKIIQTVAAYPDGEEKRQLALDIANQMKRLYLKFNRNTVENAVIINQLEQLSNGILTLPADTELTSSKDLLSATPVVAKATKSKKKKKKKKKTATGL